MSDDLAQSRLPVDTASLDERFSSLRCRVDGALTDFVESQRAELPGNLVDAAAYALLGGGKRLRPLICLLWAEAAGATVDEAMPAAVAVECIHAFSLVHDDLPAIDDDDLRRGRPTLHVHTNEAMAILAGDFLQALAYRAAERGASGPEVAAGWSREITNGAIDMIGGQVLDTFPAEGMSSPEAELAELRRVHAGKTAALIRAACRMGVIAGGTVDLLDSASRYADAIGLAFQAADDLLDVEAEAEVVGKRTGKDAAAGKRTYPGLLGIDETRREIDRLLRTAKQAVEPLGEHGAALAVVAERLAIRES